MKLRIFSLENYSTPTAYLKDDMQSSVVQADYVQNCYGILKKRKGKSDSALAVPYKGQTNYVVPKPYAEFFKSAREKLREVPLVVLMKSGNFDVKDEPRSGRPVMDKVDAILEKVNQDQHISSYDIAEELGIYHKTHLTHLKKSE
ncbi:hypothetical protein EVAR_13426_1 [Eumeta japonica]|uniref:Uncharacterized protein n=1 Tax=Eumeta variegata TaxID=151549 RepID=A0A4C1V7I6_EUMVA|nr:hypothetical protein EVAR_13426_1 [Eumeta japonica]